MQEQVEAPIQGDILESIFTHVPLLDLVPSSHVSKSWKRAVSTSLRVNKIKPWLLLYTQRTRPPHSITIHAYDPRSNLWVQISHPKPSIFPYISPLRSSHSSLLYMLSPSKFSFSFDPLHTVWHTVDPPAIWRTDPVVALVGDHVVVAGGACDFEDDPMAVEIYDMRTHTWDSSNCPSMPEAFMDSKTTRWLSVAVDSNKMYVTEKITGVTFVFCPENKSWQGPYNVVPRHDQQHIRNCATGFAGDRNCATGFVGDRMIAVGVIGGGTCRREGEELVERVKIWELNCETLEYLGEIGGMPKQLVDEINENGNEFFSSSSTTIDVNMADGMLYMYTMLNPRKVFLCEIGDGSNSTACNWRSVKINNVVVEDEIGLSERLVLTCSNVGFGDLHRAIMVENREFSVKQSAS